RELARHDVPGNADHALGELGKGEATGNEQPPRLLEVGRDLVERRGESLRGELAGDAVERDADRLLGRVLHEHVVERAARVERRGRPRLGPRRDIAWSGTLGSGGGTLFDPGLRRGGITPSPRPGGRPGAP